MLELTNFTKSIKAFDDLLLEVDGHVFNTLSSVLQEGLHAGVIQHFEVVYELSWKLIQRSLREDYGLVDINQSTKKELFREATKVGLIVDAEAWIKYHHARNSTSHTYDAMTAEQVFKIAKEFIHDAKALLAKLEAINLGAQ